MKTLCLILTSIIIFTGTINSQSNKAYCAQKITWFGLDYSQAYFIDDIAFPDPDKIIDKLFYEWNNLVFKEYKKFDIGKSFNKSDVVYNTSFINSRNNEINIYNHVSNNMFQQRNYCNDSIQKIINSYSINTKINGVGLVFIVESLNKPNREAIYWITFFDIKTKEVLLTKRIIGIPSGVGIRNYWANSFYNALIEAEREMGFIF